MCLILDTNAHSDYLTPKDAGMELLKEMVLGGKVKIAYSTLREFSGELPKQGKMRKELKRLASSNRAHDLSGTELETLMKKLKPLESGGHHKAVSYKGQIIKVLLSGDSHIIALALVAKVNLLVSRDDKLSKDFKRILKGSLYRTEGYENASPNRFKNLQKQHRDQLVDASCKMGNCTAGS